MCRKYRRTIVWVLVAAMVYSPSLVCAQPSASAEGKKKIDLGFVTPDAAAAVVVYPRHVLTAPEMEMLPTEVITAAGKKFFGIDPLEIEQIVAIAEASQGGPPQFGVVLRMSSPVDQKQIFPQIMPQTSEVPFNGKTYRKAPGPMQVCIFCPDDKTIIQASEGLLKKMLENRAAPKEGRMSKVLGRIAEPPDAMAVLFVEPLRPLIAMPLAMAPMPPPLADAKKIPDLLTSIGAKVNLTGDRGMSLTLKATDEAAAEQLEQIIDKLMDAARQQALAESARQSASSDPIEQAMGQYSKRMSDHMLKALRPVRKGQTLTLATDPSGKNAQALQITTIGIMAALLLPAVQAAREAARRTAAQNEMKNFGSDAPKSK